MYKYTLSSFIILTCVFYFHFTNAQTLEFSANVSTNSALVTSENEVVEARKAANLFIESVNDARRSLSLKEFNLAAQNIRTAAELIDVIRYVPPKKRRIVRVEFGGGVYADNLKPRKIYAPIETYSLENLSLDAGPRWVQNTRAENDAIIIYITLNLEGDNARTYLEQALEATRAKDLNSATRTLQVMTDEVIKVNDQIPPVQWASDYISLAENYVTANNFFGVRRSLGRAAEYIEEALQDNNYEKHRPKLQKLADEIAAMTQAFADMDAEQIEQAKAHFTQWKKQLLGWADAEL